MTQFMLSVHHTPGSVPYATEEEMQAAFEATAAFNERLLADGLLVFVGALHPQADVATADSVVEGRASEGAQLGGFWVVDVADRSAAVKVAKQASAACRQPVEVREFQG